MMMMRTYLHIASCQQIALNEGFLFNDRSVHYYVDSADHPFSIRQEMLTNSRRALIAVNAVDERMNVVAKINDGPGVQVFCARFQKCRSLG
jgi:hypothetical protein